MERERMERAMEMIGAAAGGPHARPIRALSLLLAPAPHQDDAGLLLGQRRRRRQRYGIDAGPIQRRWSSSSGDGSKGPAAVAPLSGKLRRRVGAAAAAASFTSSTSAAAAAAAAASGGVGVGGGGVRAPVNDASTILDVSKHQNGN